MIRAGSLGVFGIYAVPEEALPGFGNTAENIAIDAYDRSYVALPESDQIIRLDDISGANPKTLAVPRSGAYAGPKNILPLRRVGGGGTVIR